MISHLQRRLSSPGLGGGFDSDDDMGGEEPHGTGVPRPHGNVNQSAGDSPREGSYLNDLYLDGKVNPYCRM